MLTELRKVTRGWVALGIITLLALAFAIWGIHDIFRPVRSDDIASGRGFSIGQREFEVAFDNELKGVEEQAKRTVTKQEAVAANFHMRVVDKLVTQRAFDQLARQVGVDSSNAMVRARIEANPAFRNDITGAFDAASYRMLLARNRISQEMYERDLRGGMTRQQLAQALVAGMRPPSAFGRMALAFDSERRIVSIAAITPGQAPPPPAPTDAELQAFYTAQSQAFAVPEQRAFTLVRADPAAFEAHVEVPEEKIRQLFDFRKGQLTTPEKRSFVLVTGGDRAKASEAARRLATGEDANAIARALGMQAITFSQKKQSDAPDPKIGAAVFATAVGQATAAIEGLTWSAARVTEITPGVAPSFDEARPQLRSELAHEEALNLMNDAVDKFDEARAGGADLQTAAAQAGLAVTKTPLVDARGLGADGRPEASVLDKPDLIKTVFEAHEGDPSDWVSEPDGGSYLVKIDQLKPTGAPPLAQIRDRVAEAWRLQKIGQGMARIADDVAAAVRGGGSFADAVRQHGLRGYAAGQILTRANARQTASPQLAGAIFAAREGDVVNGIGGPRGEVMFVAKVEKVERTDPGADPQGVEQRRQAIRDALLSDALDTIQSAARAGAHVRLNQPLIDRVVGKTDNNEAGN